MSRFTMKDSICAAQRCISTGSPQRAVKSSNVHSTLLSTFEAELARLQTQDENLSSSKTSNGMGGIDISGSPRLGSGASVYPANLKSAPQVEKKAQYNEQSNFLLYTYKLGSPTPVRIYIRDEAEANEQVLKLRGPLGFDMEWRVLVGERFSNRKTAVIQICDLQTILIIQLSAMKVFPEKVKAVVGNKDIVKMGINILGDGRKLYHDYGVVSRGLLELTNLAHLVDHIRVPTRRMISLKRIVEMYTGYTLDKGAVQTSNWEANLSEKQLDYAANDAHSALQVYNELMRMAREQEMVLHPIVTPGNTSLPAMGMTYVTNLPANDSGKTKAKVTGSKPASESKPPILLPPPFARFGALPVTSLEQHEEMGKVRPVQRQFLRAYKLWHVERLSLPDMCVALRSAENPLAQSTVITYIVEALKADATLGFSRQRLRELAMLDFGSWRRHRWWINSLETTDRGLET